MINEDSLSFVLQLIYLNLINLKNQAMKHLLLLFVCFCLAMPHLALSQNTNEAVEPTLKGPGVINLLESGTLEGWKIPSAHWHLEAGVITGETGGEKLRAPEFLYTKQQFSNFEFTCEMRLTGDDHANTGIYYRVHTISFKGKFEAPSGYEFDAAVTTDNLTGSVGDWYQRPSLRVYADQALVDRIFKADNWSRMTMRVRGNRLEYWINGTKVMDFVDPDPKGSREGMIGFQMHDGSVMKVEYRNMRVLPL